MLYGPQLCCATHLQAAIRGHHDCFTRFFTVRGREQFIAADFEIYRSVSVALRQGNEVFARQLFHDDPEVAWRFAHDCVFEEGNGCITGRTDEAAGWLEVAISAAPAILEEDEDRVDLVQLSTYYSSPNCLSVLLQYGADWDPSYLLDAAKDNFLDILEVVLSYNITDWCPLLPGQAAYAGNVRFLNCILEHGCQLWNSAVDGEAWAGDEDTVGYYNPVGQNILEDLPDWSLVVSSDVVVSGPVLLYAAQTGVDLTPRMQDMLVEVRRRALALAGCFHRAERLSQAGGAGARAWHAMGAVPVEVIQSIAT